MADVRPKWLSRGTKLLHLRAQLSYQNVGSSCPIVRSARRPALQLTDRPGLLLLRPAVGGLRCVRLEIGCRYEDNRKSGAWSEAAMTIQDIAAALERFQSVLKRRPSAGIHEDVLAIAKWQNGMRVVVSHPDGTQILTDMPAELGGRGDQVTPGWLFRAGLASCLAARVAMGAAAAGIELSNLEVSASSRSDARGLFGMVDVSGQSVSAGPCDVELVVRVSARGESPARLRALVEDCNRCSPVSSVLRDKVPVVLKIEVGSV